MSEKSVAVVGLGSMGKRRIRLINQYDSTISIIGIDSNLTRRNEIEELFGMNTYATIEEAVSKKLIATVFVCTSPISHEAIIMGALTLGLNVFTEINLLNDYYDQAIHLAKDKGVLLYLSSTFLKRREIQYLIKAINDDSKVSYQYHVGQYLPDWHPWENYREFFVSNIRTNGCREIMAIEFPWLIKAFGNITEYAVEKNKYSNLEIEYPDSYSLLFRHETGIQGTLNINIISRIAKRDLIIVGENFQVEWGGNPDSLYRWNNREKTMDKVILYEEDDIDKNDNYSTTIIENAYFEEIQEFFECLENDYLPSYTFQQDKKVIDLINKIEE
ncbi:Gfo/Idh/MocA family oxidoreductase [Enterococcus hulanensis]|uniref:Gfo/Idh/MocA family protein n=1 Tax=Enterococcus hulanensis TaxID=2559929 RepID=UPI00288D64F5|nr:Gfo/Idh/MocA family oxidoreductase [Enterococcus hulanensis]MDT2660864.1 Gfo/Idh/MocA family oxidoreductase [Enterococcus hulanensis]